MSYVGIAADEPKRIKNERYPLMDWGITEKESLQICYDRGDDFGGLYPLYSILFLCVSMFLLVLPVAGHR